MNNSEIINYILSFVLWLFFMKSFLGFAYFDFAKWYVLGKKYRIDHKNWMNNKP